MENHDHMRKRHTVVDVGLRISENQVQGGLLSTSNGKMSGHRWL